MGTFTYVELIDWSQSLPPWQRDALRRVLANGTVNDDEISQLLDLAKAQHNDDTLTLQPVTASQDHVQPEPTDAPPVRLVRIRDIAHVNALGEGPVPFSADGITVVYGGNGTGKSGIARILKKTCLARDAGGSIRSNVFQPEPVERPHATIDFLEGDNTRSYNWKEGGPTNSSLRLVNVFDDACAAVQVNEPNLISYTPAILQVFRSLANVVNRVAATIRVEKAALGECSEKIKDLGLPGSTAAGRFLSSLRAESKQSELRQVCTISQQERERLANLDQVLAENPLKRVQELELRQRKVAETQLLVSSVFEHLSDRACDEFAALVDKQWEAEEAADLARKVFGANSELAGIGTQAWRTLWESARRYSDTHAYAGHAFPVISEGALCVLCQQVLDPEASRRLHSFEEFVKSDAQQQADAANSQVEEKKSAVIWLRLPRSVRSKLVELNLNETPEGEKLRRFFICAKLRRRHLVRVSNLQSVKTRPPLEDYAQLVEVQRRWREEVAQLRAASHAESRLAMENELADLKTRAKLAEHQDTVAHEIERLRNSQELELTLNDCRTQAITLKAREAANTIITNKLRSGFMSNLSSIGFSDNPVEVKLGPGDHGKHPYELKLMQRPEIPPEEVLSEGERRCVALAGFLAELETTDNCSGIVLDDPVSSLDHRFRKRVAERLVREGKIRQVIIFTHDVVFLYLLRKYSKELTGSLTELSLERGFKGNHGRVFEGPPWTAMLLKQRLSRLRNDLTEARQILNKGDRQGYESRVLAVYRSLRQSWERAVEEVLLYETVLRFGDAVQTQRLSKLTDISDDDVETVTKEMSRCSDFVHDEAGVVFSEIPDPDVVESDISRLSDWVRAVRERRK